MELLGDDWYLHGDWGLEFDDEPAVTNNGHVRRGS